MTDYMAKVFQNFNDLTLHGPEEVRKTFVNSLSKQRRFLGVLYISETESGIHALTSNDRSIIRFIFTFNSYNIRIPRYYNEITCTVASINISEDTIFILIGIPGKSLPVNTDISKRRYTISVTIRTLRFGEAREVDRCAGYGSLRSPRG